MSNEVWWAIAFVVAVYVAVRLLLPRFRNRRGALPPPPEPPREPSSTSDEDSEAPWSKTQRFTEKTVQLPPKD